MTQLSRFTFLCVTLIACVIAQADSQSDLHQLFDDEWQYRSDNSPYWGQVSGRDGAETELGDISPEAMLNNYRAYRAFIERLDAIDRDKLTVTDQINYDVFRAEVTETLVAWQIIVLACVAICFIAYVLSFMCCHVYCLATVFAAVTPLVAVSAIGSDRTALAMWAVCTAL